MKFRKSLKILFFLFALSSPFLARAQWEEVTSNHVTFVTLSSFCRFYFFQMTGDSNGEHVELIGPYGTIKIRADNRECYIDNLRLWLSFPIARLPNGTLGISKIDVADVFEPILRPERLSPRHEIKGVIIDPGHGGPDQGASCDGVNEKTLNLDTANRLETLLKAKGIATAMTRRDDSFPSLEERAKYTEVFPDYIFVSIHYNQGPATSRGIETFAETPLYAPSTSDSVTRSLKYAMANPNDANAASSALLASLIHRQVVQIQPPEGDRGMKKARFAVLRLSTSPAVLVEGGFISDRPVDLPKVRTEKYRQELAEKIATGIEQFISLMKLPETPLRKFSGMEFRDTRPAVDLRTLGNVMDPMPPIIPCTNIFTNSTNVLVFPATDLHPATNAPHLPEPEDGRVISTNNEPVTSTNTTTNAIPVSAPPKPVPGETNPYRS